MRKVSVTTSILFALLMSIFIAPNAKADGYFSCSGGGGYSVYGGVAYGYFCTDVLDLDSTVTAIGDSGFYNYYWPDSNEPITSVNIPNSVITIGRNAFYLVFSITNLTFGNSVETIGDYSFEGANPPSLLLPDSLKYIGNFSMKHMFRVTSLVIPNRVTFIGQDAFDRSPLTTLTLGRSVTTIGHNAFRSAQLTCLTNLSSLTTADLNNAGIANAATVPSCRPAITSAVVTGTPKVGQFLMVTPSTTGIVASTTYQWQRSEKSNSEFTNISGANTATYQLTAKDSEKYLRVSVSVINGLDSATRISAATSRVAESSNENSKENQKEKDKEKDKKK